MSEQKDIWSNNKGRLPEDKLMAYLEGKLSPEEQHKVERWLAEEGMESDALEGLKDIEPEETKRIAHQLNHNLRTQMAGKKRRTRPIADNQWSWLAILIILILAVACYMVIRLALTR